ncbi:MAG: dihydrolipoamide acetyltransferase family protein [Bacteroidia bacterium]|nr:dihydrolipoamide acetyltransferase family protein [Bacteroidia bacterium]
MARIEVQVPAMGEGIKEATITRWLKKTGEPVKEDDSIVEIATDKVDSEIPSPVEGTMTEQLFKEGDSVMVGSVIAIISTGKEDEPEPQKPGLPEINISHGPLKTVAKTSVTDDQNNTPYFTDRKTPSGKFLSPLVRSIAEKEGITAAELDSITGSGKDNRISKDDLVLYLKNRNAGISDIITSAEKTEVIPVKEIPAPVQVVTSQTKSYGSNVEIIEMDRMRKLIAEKMLLSKQLSAHVTSFVEVDVTGMVSWRDQVKDDFLKRENTKLTFTPLFVEAAVKALRDFPMINVSVDGTKIIVKKFVNIGIATALPSGNLIVPVIKNADQKNLAGLARSVNDLADRARKNKLLPDEITEGTFTITNFGTFSNLTGTPIINQPEVAILGVGAIIKKPAVVTTSAGDFIAIRHMMILSLSYDHRVVDGALGGQFLWKVGDYLGNWDITRKV